MRSTGRRVDDGTGSSVGAAARTALATVAAGTAGAALTRAAVSTATALPLTGRGPAAPGTLEAVVTLVCATVGAAAAVTLAVGCALMLLAHVARLALGVTSRTAARVDRLASLLTPRALRRVLALGVGGVLLATPAAAVDDTVAPEVGLGWSVTTSPRLPDASVAAAPPAAPTPTGPAPVTAVAPASAAAAGPGPATPTRPARAGGGGSPDAGPSLTTTAATSTPAAHPGHVVAPGDSLWSIAARQLGPGADDAAVAALWPRWYAANADVVGPDPGLLLPGQVLTPPAGTPGPLEP